MGWWVYSKPYDAGSHRVSCNTDVQERKVAISFCLYSELDIPMDITQIVKEALQLLKTMRPDDNSVIHITDKQTSL
jgi:hypothetical protein